MERMLTAREVAARAEIPRKSVYRLARTGVIASYRVGGVCRFLPSDVAVFVDAHQKAARARAARRLAEFSNEP